MMNRRHLITGLISLVAAPAIVRAGSLMPVKLMLPTPSPLIETGFTFASEDVTFTPSTGPCNFGIFYDVETGWITHVMHNGEWEKVPHEQD